MLTFERCEKLMASARNSAAGKPLANNTRLERRGPDAFAVRLHSTDILTIERGGAYTYDSGGWRTATTKDRMNEYGPLRIYQHRGEWFVITPGNIGNPDAPAAVYADGMRYGETGGLSGAGAASLVAENRKLARRIAEYARGFVAELYAGRIKKPSAGDCWYCALRDENGRTLGECNGDQSHLRAHLDERYYVPSLLFTALERTGASIAEKQTAAALVSGQPEYAFPGDWTREQMQRHLSRYIRAQLRLAN